MKKSKLYAAFVRYERARQKVEDCSPDIYFFDTLKEAAKRSYINRRSELIKLLKDADLTLNEEVGKCQ